MRVLKEVGLTSGFVAMVDSKDIPRYNRLAKVAPQTTDKGSSNP